MVKKNINYMILDIYELLHFIQYINQSKNVLNQSFLIFLISMTTNFGLNEIDILVIDFEVDLISFLACCPS